MSHCKIAVAGNYFLEEPESEEKWFGMVRKAVWKVVMHRSGILESSAEES